MMAPNRKARTAPRVVVIRGSFAGTSPSPAAAEPSGDRLDGQTGRHRETAEVRRGLVRLHDDGGDRELELVGDTLGEAGDVHGGPGEDAVLPVLRGVLGA